VSTVLVVVWFEVRVNKLPSWDTSGCECKPARSVSATVRNLKKFRAAIQKMFGSGIAKRIPRGVVAVLREKFRLGYHPGALRHPSCSRRGAGISNKTATRTSDITRYRRICCDPFTPSV